MKVYKFGGASVRHAEGVRNLLNIVRDEAELFVIVTAMGKTTNNLELLLSEKTGAADDWQSTLSRLKDYHYEIIDNLFGADVEDVRSKIDHFFRLLEEQMQLASLPTSTPRAQTDGVCSLCAKYSVISSAISPLTSSHIPT